MQQIFSIVFISCISLAFTQNDWQIFSNPSGNFKVEVPGTMQENVQEIQTAIGPLTYHTFIHQSTQDSADNVLYLLSYCDYPEGGMHSDSTALLKDFFETTISTATESVDGVLAYSTEDQLGDYPGRLWRIHYNGGAATIKTKAFLVGPRFYSVQTVTYRERSLNKSSERYLNSFRLLTKQ
ncbi:MAG: hypothetical protein AAFO94_09410 [Bacteroidota bacterium]